MEARRYSTSPAGPRAKGPDDGGLGRRTLALRLDDALDLGALLHEARVADRVRDRKRGRLGALALGRRGRSRLDPAAPGAHDLEAPEPLRSHFETFRLSARGSLQCSCRGG